MRSRLILFSVLLSLTVVLSFSWLAKQSLRGTFREWRREYHASLFRISGEHMDAYLLGLNGKLTSLARQKNVDRFMNDQTARTNFSRIASQLGVVGTVLYQQFWPQDQVEELVLIGTNGVAGFFGFDLSHWYLGESFDMKKFTEHFGAWAEIKPGMTLLFYCTKELSADLSPTMADRLVFLKRASSEDGKDGGLLLAVLSPTFLPSLFNGLSEGCKLSIADQTGPSIWASEGRWTDEADAIVSNFSFGSQPLRLTIESSERAIYPELRRVDIVLLLSSIACLALAVIASLALAGRTMLPLTQLTDKLRSYTSEEPVQPIAIPRRSIPARLALYFALCVLGPASVFIGVVSAYSFRTIGETVRSSVADTLRQAESVIDYRFDLYNELTAQFIYSDQFQNLWKARSAAPFSQADLAFISSSFDDLRRTQGEFAALSLYELSGKPLYNTLEVGGGAIGDLLGNRIDELRGSIGQLVFIGAAESHYQRGWLVFGRKVRGLSYADHPDVAYAVFFIDPYRLGQIYGTLGSKLAQYLYVVDVNDVVLTGYGPRGPEFPPRDRVRLERSSSDWGYRIIGEIPTAEIRTSMFPILWSGALIIAFYLLVIFALSLLFASAMIRPIRRLLADLDSEAAARLSTPTLPRWLAGRSELAEIATRFNELILDNYRRRILEREAQLNALQQQINPHFMYNTLEAIKWMAYKQKARDIADMATAMGNFLRGNMALSDHLTTLADEIDHLKSYLYIQQIRYGDLFEVRWDLEETTLQVQVIRLILQPLVENAINHGFYEIRYKGLLSIHAHRFDGEIRLVIEDNGVGMDAATLEKVRASLDTEKTGNSASIGLSNVNRRLKLHFGSASGLRIESRTGEGTVVSITLPG